MGVVETSTMTQNPYTSRFKHGDNGEGMLFKSDDWANMVESPCLCFGVDCAVGGSHGPDIGSIVLRTRPIAIT